SPRHRVGSRNGSHNGCSHSHSGSCSTPSPAAPHAPSPPTTAANSHQASRPPPTFGRGGGRKIPAKSGSRNGRPVGGRGPPVRELVPDHDLQAARHRDRGER